MARLIKIIRTEIAVAKTAVWHLTTIFGAPTYDWTQIVGCLQNTNKLSIIEGAISSFLFLGLKLQSPGD